MNRLKVQIVMLPTDKATRLYLYTKDNSLTYYHKPQQGGGNYPEVINQNLYILSDEKIVEGEEGWKYCFNTNTILPIRHCENGLCKDCKKIIATTDESVTIKYFSHYSQDLVKVAVYKDKGLPRPSDAFLKKYCEMNGSIEYAYVELEGYKINGMLDEATSWKLKVAPDNTISIRGLRENCTTLEMFDNMQYYMEYCQANDYVTPQDWIEKYKHF